MLYSDWQRDNRPSLAEISLLFFDQTHLPLRLDTPPLRPHPPSLDFTHLPLRSHSHLSTPLTIPRLHRHSLNPPSFLSHLCISLSCRSLIRHFEHTPLLRGGWRGHKAPSNNPGWAATPPSRVAMATHLPSTSLTFRRPHPPFFLILFGLTHLPSTTSTFHVDRTHLPVRSHPPFLCALLSPPISQELYACGIWHSPALKRLSQVTFPSHIHVYTQSADASGSPHDTSAPPRRPGSLSTTFSLTLRLFSALSLRTCHPEPTHIS